jgi:hypothetical protein
MFFSGCRRPVDSEFGSRFELATLAIFCRSDRADIWYRNRKKDRYKEARWEGGGGGWNRKRKNEY